MGKIPKNRSLQLPNHAELDYEWEQQFERFFGNETDAELAEFARDVAFEKRDRTHAYSHTDLADLRKLLFLKKGSWPDRRLHRHTDALAILVGLPVRLERKMTAGKRCTDLTERFLKPAQLILDAMVDPEREHEFGVPWSKYKGFDMNAFRKQLATFIRRTRSQIDLIRREAKKGKPWDSDLKDHFMDQLACLCEYLNHDFEPTRNDDLHKGFRGIADLLGTPLFPPVKSGDPANFRAALRKHVDHWNRAKRDMVKKSKLGRERPIMS